MIHFCLGNSCGSATLVEGSCCVLFQRLLCSYPLAPLVMPALETRPTAANNTILSCCGCILFDPASSSHQNRTLMPENNVCKSPPSTAPFRLSRQTARRAAVPRPGVQSPAEWRPYFSSRPSSTHSCCCPSFCWPAAVRVLKQNQISWQD